MGGACLSLRPDACAAGGRENRVTHFMVIAGSVPGNDGLAPPRRYVTPLVYYGLGALSKCKFPPPVEQSRVS